MAKEPRQTQLGKQLRDSFEQWNYIYKNGCGDPFWEDGCNLNLVRNHILSAKRQCEEELSPEDFPEEYELLTPPEVDNKYMARAEEIRRNAKETLAVYLSDADYQYLVASENRLDKEQKEQTSIANVIGYAKGLKMSIEQDDLLSMRRHEHSEHYIESFRSCRKKVEELLKKPKELAVKPGQQISLFDLFGDMMM